MLNSRDAKVPVCMERGEIDRLLLRARGLAVLRGVLTSSASRDFLALLGLLAAGMRRLLERRSLRRPSGQ